jgi:hypothetical protein
MAQGTKSSGKRSSSSRSSSRNGSSTKASSRSSRRGSSNGSQANRKRSSSPKARSRTKSTGRTAASRGAARNAGGAVTQVVSKAKTPLLAGGAALAGIAGGLAMRSRNNKTRNPLKKMSAPSMPKGMTKSIKKMDLSKVDVDSLTSAAQRIGKIGQQVGDVAEAAEKTRKKNK